MSAQVQEPDDWDDLLPDDLRAKPKGRAKPLQRTSKQKAANDLANAQSTQQAQAARLAQIVNLHIGGYSLAAIGASIGATADEVDRLLANETARYVRSQPALRTYVRNFISEKYTGLLNAVWDEAVDKQHPHKLEHQDRALRILNNMAKLHGAEAPTQTEVKVTEAPEAVERLVQALAKGAGMGYDTDIFDVEYTESVHEAVEQTHKALEVSGNHVEESDGDDDL